MRAPFARNVSALNGGMSSMKPSTLGKMGLGLSLANHAIGMAFYLNNMNRNFRVEASANVPKIGSGANNFSLGVDPFAGSKFNTSKSRYRP